MERYRKMENRKESLTGIKPIFYTIVFEIKKQRKKLYFFSLITIIVAFLMGFVLQLIPTFLLSDTQAEFFNNGLQFISFISLFAACLFFSGIICSEFDKKTGFIVFPKINKYKLILGKYFGNLTLVVVIITLYYFILGILGFFYYGGPINIRFFYSYGIAILYIIALSSFVTFFSSFMRSVNLTIISTVILLLIGFNIADQIVTLIFADSFEPLYSLAYLGTLITGILEFPFPDPRYSEFSFSGMGPGGMGGDFTFGQWVTPSVGMGITLLLVFIVIYFLLAAYLFKRRQL
jgi:ABC-type transport system involved in multi-copper enzyme maturation permease subunit